MRPRRAAAAGATAPFYEGDEWQAKLSAIAPDWPQKVKTIGPIPRLVEVEGGWLAL